MKLPGSMYASHLHNALSNANLHAQYFARGIMSTDTVDLSCDWVAEVIENAARDGVIKELLLPEA